MGEEMQEQTAAEPRALHAEEENGRSGRERHRNRSDRSHRYRSGRKS